MELAKIGGALPNFVLTDTATVRQVSYSSFQRKRRLVVLVLNDAGKAWLAGAVRQGGAFAERDMTVLAVTEIILSCDADNTKTTLACLQLRCVKNVPHPHNTGAGTSFAHSVAFSVIVGKTPKGSHRMKCIKNWATVALLVSVFSASSAQAASSLETFVMGTTGQSSYGTYGTPSPVFYNFGGLGVSIPSNPAGLAASDISGEYRVNNSATATALADSITATGSGNSTWGAWDYSGSSSTHVAYGTLGSESYAVHTGGSDGKTTNSAESYAIMRDSLNPTSPGVTVGSNGTMRLAVAVDGMMTVTGTGTVGMALRYGYGTPRPGYSAMGDVLLDVRGSIYGNGYDYWVNSSFGAQVAPTGMGLTLGANLPSGLPSSLSFGGASTVYATVPITFGADTDFRMGMMTYTGAIRNGTMDSQFGHTATISGIEIFDGAGNAVPNFTIRSGSGTTYTAQGVQTVVPESGTVALLFGGLIVGAARFRLRHRNV